MTLATTKPSPTKERRRTDVTTTIHDTQPQEESLKETKGGSDKVHPPALLKPKEKSSRLLPNEKNFPNPGSGLLGRDSVLDYVCRSASAVTALGSMYTRLVQSLLVRSASGKRRLRFAPSPHSKTWRHFDA